MQSSFVQERGVLFIQYGAEDPIGVAATRVVNVSQLAFLSALTHSIASWARRVASALFFEKVAFLIE